MITYHHRRALDYARAVHDSASAEEQYLEARLLEENIRLKMLRDAKDESSGRLKDAKRQLASVRQEFYEQGIHPHLSVPPTSVARAGNDALTGTNSADSRSPSPA